ncbi:GTPase [Alcanivorax sp.]|jgi:signal recognition particle receptor subunit beta|uniref:GTP-binding protein n=1 Tax=Alcanivorax sp. TaxID=1872427 RepID=UPI0032D960BE
MTNDEFKILFTGPMGAGKTTAISALSDQECISTDVLNTDIDQCDKAMTTAALDYGFIDIPGGGVRLYGTPGQERFRFMWPILANNAAGVIVLLNGEHPDLDTHLSVFVDAFWEQGAMPMVIGVGRLASEDFDVIERITDILLERHISPPIFSVDVREKDDVLLLVEALLCQIEVNEMGMMQA